nr:glycosyltransferase [Cytophagales bacterium]
MEFLFITNLIWDTPPKARKQLTQSLIKNYKVSFVVGNKFGTPGLRTTALGPSLDLITPSFPVSRPLRYRTPVMNEIYQKWLFPQLKEMFSEKKDLYVLCADFGGYLAPQYFKRLIYFASDDYINNVKVPFFVKAYTKFTQQRLVSSAYMALATAKTLVDGFRTYNTFSYELPLGAPDVKIQKSPEEILRPRDGKIKVVLLGYIDKVKTPVSLLNKILELGNTELYLIGPITDTILDDLSPADRIHVLGTQSGEKLFNFLTEMDVAIAPYYMEDPNSGRTPNKMWQYLACGKPAVITNLPNVQHWQFPEGTVYKANTEEEFVAEVKQAYHDDSVQLIEKRQLIAKENSWDQRAKLLLELIEKREQAITR